MFDDLGIVLHDNLNESLQYVDPMMRAIFKSNLSNKDWDKIEPDTKEQGMDAQPIEYLSPFGLPSRYKKRINLSCCSFRLQLSNIGTEVIEDYKIYFKLHEVLNAERVSKRTDFMDLSKYVYDTIFTSEGEGIIKPVDNLLVQNDTHVFDQICFRPMFESTKVILSWKLLAKNFTKSGELIIELNQVVDDINWHRCVDVVENHTTETIVKTMYEYE